MMRRVKKLLAGKKRETGGELREGLMQCDRRNKLAVALKRETDERNRIWIGVKLLGERKVDLARELGYGSSVAVYQILKRVEQRAQQDSPKRQSSASGRRCVL